jgi:hypothetical protein
MERTGLAPMPPLRQVLVTYFAERSVTPTSRK